MLGKALYQTQKYIEYEKHISRLNEIEHKPLRRKGYEESSPLEKMHKIRNKSFAYNVKQKQSKLDHENEKIVRKIVGFSTKKSISHFKEKSMIEFQNSHRKQR